MARKDQNFRALYFASFLCICKFFRFHVKIFSVSLLTLATVGHLASSSTFPREQTLSTARQFKLLSTNLFAPSEWLHSNATSLLSSSFSESKPRHHPKNLNVTGHSRFVDEVIAAIDAEGYSDDNTEASNTLLPLNSSSVTVINRPDSNKLDVNISRSTIPTVNVVDYSYEFDTTSTSSVDQNFIINQPNNLYFSSTPSITATVATTTLASAQLQPATLGQLRTPQVSMRQYGPTSGGSSGWPSSTGFAGGSSYPTTTNQGNTAGSQQQQQQQQTSSGSFYRIDPITGAQIDCPDMTCAPQSNPNPWATNPADTNTGGPNRYGGGSSSYANTDQYKDNNPKPYTIPPTPPPPAVGTGSQYGGGGGNPNNEQNYDNNAYQNDYTNNNGGTGGSGSNLQICAAGTTSLQNECTDSSSCTDSGTSCMNVSIPVRGRNNQVQQAQTLRCVCSRDKRYPCCDHADCQQRFGRADLRCIPSRSCPGQEGIGYCREQRVDLRTGEINTGQRRLRDVTKKQIKNSSSSNSAWVPDT